MALKLFFTTAMRKSLLLLAAMLAFLCAAHAQIITTFAGGGTGGDGGLAVDCSLNLPYSTAIDAAGNVYIADADNNRVRKVDVAGIITTFAGTGAAGYSGDDSPATVAMLSDPVGVAVDASGNVYISDAGNSRIRKVNTAGVITTVAGTEIRGYNGDNIPATAAELYLPVGIAIDGSGNLYICDGGNFRVRMVNTSGIITTIAGTGTLGFGSYGGPATATDINQPVGIAVDAAGNIFFTDDADEYVFRVNTSGIFTTVAGNGHTGYNGDNIPATTAHLSSPNGLAVDADENVYIADYGNDRIRKVNTSGIITTYVTLEAPIGVTVDNSGNLYICQDDYVKYILNTVSIKNIINPKPDIKVYPNPCNGDFTVTISSAIDEQANIIITNIEGETIKEIYTTTNTPLNVKVDERAGLYFISATTTHGTSFEKLVIAP